MNTILGIDQRLPMSSRHLLFSAILGLLFVSFSDFAGADTIVLNPMQDNTIYEDNMTNSNGSGEFIFAGNNGGGSPRRSLILFDLASLPSNAVIDSATVTLELSATGAGDTDVSFHRLLSDWGESTSDAAGGEGGGTAAAVGDATWLHTFFDNQFWTTEGGDFIATPSATTTVGFIDTYSWSSTGLADDVQGWLDGDFNNFGWIVIGDESAISSSSKRFNSRSNSFNPPTLTVEFTTIPEPSTSSLLLAICLASFRRRPKA